MASSYYVNKELTSIKYYNEENDYDYQPENNEYQISLGDKELIKTITEIAM